MENLTQYIGTGVVSLHESLLDDTDMMIKKISHLHKIKESYDPEDWVRYNKAWYDHFADIFDESDRDKRIRNILLALHIYKALSWPIGLVVGEDENYMDDDYDLSDAECIEMDDYYYSYLDEMIEEAQKALDGDKSSDHMWSARSSGSVLISLFDSPEGFIQWSEKNVPEDSKYKKYYNDIKKELGKFISK